VFLAVSHGLFKLHPMGWSLLLSLFVF
jgi:hypothetical protein